MHEFYLTEQILQSVTDSLPEDISPEQIQEVHLQLGAFEAVVPETLEFLFNTLKKRYHMPEALLKWEIIPIKAECRGCGAIFVVDEPIFLCPHCGSGDNQLLQGRGIILTRIIASAERYENSSDNINHSGDNTRG